MPRRLLYEEHLPAYQEGFRHRNRNQVVHETGSANPLYADSVARAPGEYGSLKSYTEGFGRRSKSGDFMKNYWWIILIIFVVLLISLNLYSNRNTISKPKYYYF